MNLNQVTLPVSQLARSMGFYQSLGLELIVRSDAYARFECPEGDATLSLHLADSVTSSQVLIYFEQRSNEQLDRACARLKSRGIEFDSGPTDQRWGWREARLQDPDGHRLCLFHGGSYRKHPPWRLDTAESDRRGSTGR